MEQNSLNTLELALSALSAATATKHEFDETMQTRGGGPLRYVLEIVGKAFITWFDEDTSMLVVTPVEKWDLQNWEELLDETDIVPVLTFQQISGRAFLNMAERATATS